MGSEDDDADYDFVDNESDDSEDITSHRQQMVNCAIMWARRHFKCHPLKHIILLNFLKDMGSSLQLRSLWQGICMELNGASIIFFGVSRTGFTPHVITIKAGEWDSPALQHVSDDMVDHIFSHLGEFKPV